MRTAQNLQKLHVEPKEVIGFMAKNNEHLAPIVFAAFCLNCPINALDPSFGKTEILHMLKITKPRIMFCDVEAHHLVSTCLRELGNDAKIYTFGGQTGTSKHVENLFSETGNENDFTPVNVDGVNDIVAIVCSSGTTGLSKGVAFSHASALDQITQIHTFNTDDVFLCFSSLYWLSGFLILLMGTYNGATRIITKQVFSAELQLRLIEQYKVTFCMSAPYQLTLLLRSEAIHETNLSSLKYYAVGGSKVPCSIPVEMNKRLKNGKVFVVIIFFYNTFYLKRC